MKIARVRHERCDHGTVANTYVWIPENMTEEEFEKYADLAKKQYLEAEQDLKNFPEKPYDPGYSPQYDRYPNKSVSEVKAEHEKLQIVYKQWKDKRDAARWFYSSHLVAVSEGKIKNFWDEELPIETSIFWGHRHGETLKYDEEDPTDADLEGSEKYPDNGY